MERLLIRMAMWWRRPPSRRFIMAGVAVILIAAAIYGIEQAGYWPDWATADHMGRRGNALKAVPLE